MTKRKAKEKAKTKAKPQGCGKPAPALPRKPGRPSKYTPELVDEICERLSKGEPLAQICRDEHMPHPSTVRDWAETNSAVSRAIARAREDGFDAIALEALAIADNTGLEQHDTIETPFGTMPNKEWMMRSKLRVDTRLKLLAKWDPKRYGEKLELASDPGRPVQVVMNLTGEAKKP